MLGAAEITAGIAGGALMLASLASRLFFLSDRVRDESAINPGDAGAESATPPGVRDQESAVDADRGPGRPTGVRGQSGAIPGPAAAGRSRSPRGVEPPSDAYMPASEHIARFLAWILTAPDGRQRAVRRPHDVLFSRYLDWSAFHYVEPIPEKTWQTLMKRHRQVQWKREPQKDPATGRILRKPSGAPERVTYYPARCPWRTSSRLIPCSRENLLRVVAGSLRRRAPSNRCRGLHNVVFRNSP
jgi:hypothetical protein